MIKQIIAVSFLACFSIVTNNATALTFQYKDLQTIRHLYDAHQLPSKALFIGIPVESIAQPQKNADEVLAYFNAIINTNNNRQENEPMVIPVPVLSLPELITRNETIELQKQRIRDYVQREISNFDAVIIPGDNYNMPPFPKDVDPINAIMEHDGKRHRDQRPSIYGLNRDEFYELNPNHQLNPHSLSTKVEAMSILFAIEQKMPIMTSCHGTQLYGLLKGAHMIYGILDHGSMQKHPVSIAPNSKMFDILGPFDRLSPHFHSLALSQSEFPSSLSIVGTFNGIIEIIEDKNKDDYFGFQSHPELANNHPAIAAWVRMVRNSQQDQP